MPLSVNVPATSAVVVSPLVFTFLSSLASNEISGYLAASIHLSLSRCCCCMGLPTCRDELATMILPLAAEGSAGSNVTVPEMPVALPLRASNSASSLKTALFTPLGSLKSKVCDAANAVPARLPSAIRRTSLVFMCDLVVLSRLRFEFVYCGKKTKSRPGFPLPQGLLQENRRRAQSASGIRQP